MTPSLSVLFCVYNGERYLKDAVQSVLAQTYTDFELVLVDDGSTDTTPNILDSFDDSRIVSFRNETNRGLVASLNIGIAHSRGKYLVRMDADDQSLSDRFQRQMDYMELHPEVGVLGCWMEQLNEANGDREILKVPAEHDLIRWKMLFESVVFHATVMMRRELVVREGGYDERFLHIEDTELWSRLILKTRFANLEDVLYVRRWHSASICNIHYNEQYRLGAVLRHRMLQDMTGREIDFQLIDNYSRKLTVGGPFDLLDRIRIANLLILTARSYGSNLGKETARQISADLTGRLMKLFGVTALFCAVKKRLKALVKND